MEYMINCPDNSSSEHIKCTICHADIKTRDNLYQTTFTMRTICCQCRQRFTVDDIEMISSLFLVYGGYFGQLKSDVAIEELIAEFVRNLDKGKEFHQIHLELWHKVLLHGLTPDQFIEGINRFLNKL